MGPVHASLYPQHIQTWLHTQCGQQLHAVCSAPSWHLTGTSVLCLDAKWLLGGSLQNQKDL